MHWKKPKRLRSQNWCGRWIALLDAPPHRLDPCAFGGQKPSRFINLSSSFFCLKLHPGSLTNSLHIAEWFRSLIIRALSLKNIVPSSIEIKHTMPVCNQSERGCRKRDSPFIAYMVVCLVRCNPVWKLLSSCKTK